MTRAVLVLAVLPGLVTPPAKAQDTLTELVEELELEYTRAKAAYDIVFANWQRLDRQWNALMDELDERGDEELDDEELERAQRISAETARAENDLRRRAEEWRVAGEALGNTLHAHLELLSDEIRTAPDDTSGTDLVTEYLYQDNRLREVDAELEPQRNDLFVSFLDGEPVPFPDLLASSTDGPAELRVKATLLEDRARRMERTIGQISDRIERLDERRQRDREMADFLAENDRFGSGRVPVTGMGPTRSPGDGSARDTTDVNLARLPLDEQIRRLTDLRDQVQQRMELVRARVEEYRERAGRRTA